jgi:hypothetical protein
MVRHHRVRRVRDSRDYVEQSRHGKEMGLSVVWSIGKGARTIRDHRVRWIPTSDLEGRIGA